MAIEILNGGGAERVKIDGERVRDRMELLSWPNNNLFFGVFPFYIRTEKGISFENYDQLIDVLVDKNCNIHIIYANDSSSSVDAEVFYCCYSPNNNKIRDYKIGDADTLPISGGLVYDDNNDIVYACLEQPLHASSYEKGYFLFHKIIQLSDNEGIVIHQQDAYAYKANHDLRTDLNTNYFYKAKFCWVNNIIYCITPNFPSYYIVRRFDCVSKTWKETKFHEEGLTTEKISEYTFHPFVYNNKIYFLGESYKKVFVFNPTNKNLSLIPIETQEGVATPLTHITSQTACLQGSSAWSIYQSQIKNDKVIVFDLLATVNGSYSSQHQKISASSYNSNVNCVITSNKHVIPFPTKIYVPNILKI